MATASTPTNFYLQQGNSQVYLTWDIMSGATGYGVQRGTDGANFTTLSSPSVNNLLDTSGTVGVNYYYQVASINGSGTSAYCTAQSIVPAPTAELSLGQIRLMAQQRADRVNSQFVTLPEWNTYINQSYFELYDLLVTLYEDYYIAAPAGFMTTGVTGYSLPDGATNFLNSSNQNFVAPPFYKLRGVDCGLSPTNNAWVTLKQFNFIARNKYVYPNITSTPLGVFNMQYRLMGNQIQFIPNPASGQRINLWYIPRVIQLLKDTDIMDGVSGWTEYVIIDAAIKALQKEESDVSVLMAQKQAMIVRIQSSAMNRDAGSPQTVSDSRMSGGYWGDPGGGGPFGGW